MGLGAGHYFASTAGRWLPAAAATVGLAMLLRTLLPGGSWPAFAAKCAILLTAYIPVALGVVLGPPERASVLRTALHFLRPSRTAVLPEEA
jgi:hypothetical protein